MNLDMNPGNIERMRRVVQAVMHEDDTPARRVAKLKLVMVATAQLLLDEVPSDPAGEFLATAIAIEHALPGVPRTPEYLGDLVKTMALAAQMDLLDKAGG